MSTQRTSDEILAEHHALLRKKTTAIADATRNARNKYDLQLMQLMAEFVLARKDERGAEPPEGTPPNEYSKPIDKSGCAK